MTFAHLPIQHVCLSPAGDGHLTCPQCHHTAQGHLAAFLGTQPVVTIQCRCGEIFPVHLERRRETRKRLWLPGQYIALASRHSGQMVIVALSATGLRFATRAAHLLHVGDILDVRFTVEHPSQASLCKRVRVCWVNDRIIAAAFDTSTATEGVSGFSRLPS